MSTIVLWSLFITELDECLLDLIHYKCFYISLCLAERDGVLSPLINQVLSAFTVFHVPSHQLIFSESEPSKTASLLHKRDSCDPLSVELLEDTSVDCTEPPSAPVLSCKMSSHREVVELSIPVDVVGIFHVDTLLSSVASTLKSAISTQLRIIGEETYWKVRVHLLPIHLGDIQSP